MSLTGNQSLDEMKAKRIIWPTKQDIDYSRLSYAMLDLENFISSRVPTLQSDPERTEFSYEILLQE